MLDTKNYQRLTVDRISNDGLLNLLCEFITATSNEYLFALDEYMRNKNIKECRKLYEDVKAYILSDQFSNLTHLDGSYVVEQLNIMYKKGHRTVA